MKTAGVLVMSAVMAASLLGGGLTSIPGGWWNYPILFNHSGASEASMTLSAASSRIALIAPAPLTGSITRVYFSTNTTTSTASPTNLDLRLETVDTSTGNPTGTLLATNANCSVALVDADDNVTKSCTLTASASVTIGDVFAVVIQQPGSGQANFQVMAVDAGYAGFPYTKLDNTGSWALVNSHRYMQAIFEYSDGRLFSYGGPWQQYAGDTWTSGTNPNERGNRFTVPAPMRFRGVYFNSRTGWAAGATATLHVYVGSSTTPACSSGTYHGAALYGNAGASMWRQIPMNCDLILYPGMVYRVTLRATHASNAAGVARWVAASAALMASAPGGATVHRTTLNAGAWTDTPAERYAIGPIVEALENGLYSRGR